MAMVVVDDSCLQADSQPKSCDLVWGSTAAWRYSTFIKWTEWTLAMTFSGHDDSTINIVQGLLLLLLLTVCLCTVKKYPVPLPNRPVSKTCFILFMLWQTFSDFSYVTVVYFIDFRRHSINSAYSCRTSINRLRLRWFT